MGDRIRMHLHAILKHWTRIFHVLTWVTGTNATDQKITRLGARLKLELSDRERFRGTQGEVLVQILDFPVCSIHLNFSLNSK